MHCTQCLFFNSNAFLLRIAQLYNLLLCRRQLFRPAALKGRNTDQMTIYQSSSSSFACHSLFCNREYDKHKHNLYPDRMCSLATRDKRLFVEASLVDRGQGVGDSKHHRHRRHHSLQHHCHTIFRRKSYGDFMHRNPHKC